MQTRYRSRGISPLEILKLRYSEIVGSAYFYIHFCIFKVENQVARKGHLARVFEK